MSDIFVEANKQIIAIFQERAQAVNDALAVVSRLAIGGSLDLPRKREPLIPEVSPTSRQIVLELQTTRDVVTRPEAGNNAVSTHNFVPAGTILLVLDVYDNAQTAGWTQRLSYRANARQSTQQTAIGFHVYEFGYGVGDLDVDCIVGLRSNRAGQVKKFFDLFYRAKRSRPLTNEPPTTLRYYDLYLGKTFLLTQTTLECSETVEAVNMARFRMQANILHDYDNALTTNPTNALDASRAAADSASALQSLAGLLNFGP